MDGQAFRDLRRDNCPVIRDRNTKFGSGQVNERWKPVIVTAFFDIIFMSGHTGYRWYTRPEVSRTSGTGTNFYKIFTIRS